MWLNRAFRRLDEVCALGYRGRKRGEVVRTRTTVSQAHSYQWIGSFGNRGNGRYREELRKGLAAIGRYLTIHHLPQERALLRLDGQYGNGTVLSDEDQEIDPDRWCSHSAWGQECWQLIAQWVWNLRLELGHHLHPDPVRTTEFAPPLPPPSPHTAPASGYAPPEVGSVWKTGRFAGQDFALQSDGTLRCPASQKLTPHEQRREADGSLRIVYGASIRSCRPCPLREQCQWQGGKTSKPRQVSVLLHPLPVGSAPLFWRDWSRRVHRRACQHLVRHQRLEMSLSPPAVTSPPLVEVILSRAQRAHSRLGWQERLARNARPSTAGHVTIKLFGVPAALATSLGLATA